MHCNCPITRKEYGTSCTHVPGDDFCCKCQANRVNKLWTTRLRAKARAYHLSFKQRLATRLFTYTLVLLIIFLVFRLKVPVLKLFDFLVDSVVKIVYE